MAKYIAQSICWDVEPELNLVIENRLDNCMRDALKEIWTYEWCVRDITNCSVWVCTVLKSERECFKLLGNAWLILIYLLAFDFEKKFRLVAISENYLQKCVNKVERKVIEEFNVWQRCEHFLMDGTLNKVRRTELKISCNDVVGAVKIEESIGKRYICWV